MKAPRLRTVLWLSETSTKVPSLVKNSGSHGKIVLWYYYFSSEELCLCSSACLTLSGQCEA